MNLTNRDIKIQAIRAILAGDKAEDVLLSSIPSWVVNDHDGNIKELEAYYNRPVIDRNGKLYLLPDQNKDNTMFSWFEE